MELFAGCLIGLCVGVAIVALIVAIVIKIPFVSSWIEGDDLKTAVEARQERFAETFGNVFPGKKEMEKRREHLL